MRLVSSVTWLKIDRRSAMSERILRSACMTVVWSRPPNCWPIFGSERSVSSRQRYMAIWRAVTRTRDLDVPQRSSIDSPKYEAVWPMMVAAVISGPCASGMRSLSTISASWRSTDWRLRLAKAVTRMSAPSSSRMLVEIRLAMYSSASGGALSPSWTAFLRRIAMRVSSSRLDVGEQAPFEPAAQPVFEGHQALGRAVAGDDDLLARVVQRVEGVEELFLRSFLVLQELDVVDQQHVHVAVTAPEPVL